MRSFIFSVMLLGSPLAFLTSQALAGNEVSIIDKAVLASARPIHPISAGETSTKPPADQSVQTPRPDGHRSVPVVSTLRPRIFIRADEATLGTGMTLSELRMRGNSPAYKDWVVYDGEAKGFGSLPEVAMRYLLRGDRNDALSVGEFIADRSFPLNEHTSAAAAIYYSAIAFDWVRNALPDEMAVRIAARLVAGADHLIGGVKSPSINHNYSMVSLHAVSMVALAIYGEGAAFDQKARAYLELTDDHFLKDNMLFETFRQKGGTWGEGNHYSQFVVFHPFLMTLRGLQTATDKDYFAIIRDQYDNFLEPMAKFIVANFRPDFTQERIGDVTLRVAPGGTFMRPLIDLLTAELADKKLQGQMRSFSEELSAYYGPGLVSEVYGWMMMISFDAKLPDEPSYKTLPLTMRLGKNAYEHIMFRNGWEESSTMITYISGDHYTDHQHLDKGNFLIYKKGGLTIDGGGYPSMYGQNWSNYSTRTLAHNCVLIFDPAEKPHEGVRGIEVYPDGGQRIERGTQSHRTWLDYLAISKERGLNTADVLAFDADASSRYNYVKSDLSTGYGNKAEWVDRQLLYLPQADYLIVKDRVISAEPLEKAWLLHFEETPQIDGKVPATGVTDYRNAAVTIAQRTGSVDLGGKTVDYSGKLFVRSLLPAKRTISAIGGPGYEYYNRKADKNFPPEKPFAPIMEPGNWRIELSPQKASAATVFLNAFEIADSSVKKMVPVSYIRSKDKKMEGVFFQSQGAQYIALFSASLDKRGNDFQRAVLPVRYTQRTSSPADHILTELEPGKKVKVLINGRSIGSFETTSAGVLSFHDEGVGARKVEILAE